MDARRLKARLRLANRRGGCPPRKLLTERTLSKHHYPLLLQCVEQGRHALSRPGRHFFNHSDCAVNTNQIRIGRNYETTCAIEHAPPPPSEPNAVADRWLVADGVTRLHHRTAWGAAYRPRIGGPELGKSAARSTTTRSTRCQPVSTVPPADLPKEQSIYTHG